MLNNELSKSTPGHPLAWILFFWRHGCFFVVCFPTLPSFLLSLEALMWPIMSGWVFTCMSICCKCATSWSSPGEEEKGKKEGAKEGHFLVLRAAFEQLCIMKVEDSETLPPGTWLGGEQAAHAGLHNWMPLRWSVRAPIPKLLWGVHDIGTRGLASQGILSPREYFPTFSYHSTPGSTDKAVQVGDERLAQWKGFNICSITLSGLHPLHVGSCHTGWKDLT